MKFKYIGPKILDENGNEVTVNAYGGYKVKHGDIIDLDKFLSEKAVANKNYKVHTVRRRKSHENEVGTTPNVRTQDDA